MCLCLHLHVYGRVDGGFRLVYHVAEATLHNMFNVFDGLIRRKMVPIKESTKLRLHECCSMDCVVYCVYGASVSGRPFSYQNKHASVIIKSQTNGITWAESHWKCGTKLRAQSSNGERNKVADGDDFWKVISSLNCRSFCVLILSIEHWAILTHSSYELRVGVHHFRVYWMGERVEDRRGKENER